MTFNLIYLSSLCKRRNMRPAEYRVFSDGGGFSAEVVVNGRVYHSERAHRSADAAKEEAAGIAWNICREESANNGVGERGQGRPAPARSPGGSMSSSRSSGSGGSSSSGSGSGDDEDGFGGTSAEGGGSGGLEGNRLERPSSQTLLCICGRQFVRDDGRRNRCRECLQRVRQR